jgi:hypothetical protein
MVTSGQLYVLIVSPLEKVLTAPTRLSMNGPQSSSTYMGKIKCSTPSKKQNSVLQ